MALSEDQRREVAAALVEAERTKKWIEPLTVTYPDADMEDAYAIGALVTAAKVAGGRIVKGHKIGYTSKAMREAWGATEPDYGTLFDDWFLPEGGTVSMASLNMPYVEIELAFVLKERLGGPSVNEADVIRATDFILPSIEIVDTRYNAYTEAGGVIDSTSDAASCAFVTLGGRPVRLTDIDPRHAGGALYINGEVATSGTGASVMGNPINAVAWLARKLHAFGVSMDAGHTILSGSFIAAASIGAGDTIVADFGPLGQISLGVAE